MASNTSQPPLFFPNFKAEDGNASPKEFLRFLHDLTAQHLSSSTAAKQYSKDIWATIMMALTDNILSSFPAPEAMPWNAMAEKIQLVQATVEIIYRVFTQVDDIYRDSKDIMKKVFSRLLDICFALDLWVEVEVPVEPSLPSPSFLRQKVMETLVEVLRGLGNATSPSEAQDTYVMLRQLGFEILNVNQSLTSSATPFSFPVSIKWFVQDHIEELKGGATTPSQDDTSCSVVLDSVAQVPIFLATALQASFLVFFKTLASQLLLHDVQLSLLESLKALIEYCLSPSASTTNASRSRILSRILQLHHPATTSEAARTFHYIATRLVQSRMDGVLHVDTHILDEVLKGYLESQSQQPTRSLVIQATHILKGDMQQHPDLVSLAASYLKNCVAHADDQTLLLIHEELNQCSNPEATSIQTEMQQQARVLPLTQPLSTHNDSKKLNMKEHIWRREIKKLVQTIIAPYPLAWMDDEFRPNETHFVRRVLNDVCDRFTGPLEKQDEGSRLELSKQLARLPCLLTLCSGEDCIAFRKADGFSTVHLYLPAMEALLQGGPDEVTPAVKRSVFKALCPVLRHRNEEDPGQQVMDLVFKGLGDKDRSTRLQAGSALHAVIQFYAQVVVAARIPTTPIFDRVYQLIDSGKGPIKETLVVSIAKMGTTTNQEILGNIMCLLVAQLGRSNILIRSLACTQILSISMHHKKTPYSLILPFLDQVAPFVVNRLCSEPTLLQEICKLMAISLVDFLSTNLSRTLPDLLVRCDSQGLDIIAKYLERDRHSLIVGENIHLHLAPIFLLRSPASTNKAITFFLGILNEASSTRIDLRQVLPGCTTALLTELVVMMGDDSPSVNVLAKVAVQKVETAIRTGNSHPSQGSDPGVFLASQMLGIISRIIDMLQDVHGKKSVSAKQKILRSLGALIVLIGPPIHSVASQIMATFQTMISLPELSEVTIESWHKFLTTMGPAELGPHLGATCAAFVSSWSTLSQPSRQIVCESLHHIFSQFATDLSQYLDEIVDLSVVDELKPLQEQVYALRGQIEPQHVLYPLLARCSSNNITVATLSLSELRRFMQCEHRSYVQSLASGDMFEPTLGRILSTLYKAACRDGDGTESLRVLAYECVGVLGAVDPYRFEMASAESDMVVTKNFTEEGETMAFVLHLIQDLLVDSFRSTSDIKYQTNLAYPIQELLKHCGFSSDLVNSGRPAPVKIRNRWNSLSKDVLDVITPLLEGRFTFNQHFNANMRIPVYPTQSTYREWLQLWATYLISKVSGTDAQKIFRVFLSVVRSKDVVIAKHLLPHLVLNIIISGNPDDAQNIRDEILAVLKDQVDVGSTSTTDKKLLSAQAIFALLDHLNRWARVVRRELGKKKAESKRARANHISYEAEEQLVRLDSILSSIDQNLMARAAFQCKAFARSLMSFEQQILALQQQGNTQEEYYERVHEIYAHLDEPDGMEGVSSLILSPSLEHQIREHESTGKWTAAQSCWEVRLQHDPDNLDFHLGLLRCLRNLGHYDTLRNHVKGVLTNHPAWESALADFHVESSWMVGAWDDISALIGRVDVQTPGIVLAKVLLAMRSNNREDVSSTLVIARRILGAPITASGIDGYRRTYSSALNLHMTHELELIYNIAKDIPTTPSLRRKALSGLSSVLTCRLDSTLPTFRCREPILSMRRIGFSLMPSSHPDLVSEVGSTWLASAKIARKAGHWQTAYSAMLQARQNDASLYFIESAKLVKAAGEPLRALQELETFMRSLGLTEDSTVLDLTIDEELIGKVKGKLYLLRARWMNESERYEATSILEAFRTANELDKKMESSHFYFGNFYDKCYKELKPGDILKRGIKMIMYTVRNYAKAIRFGSKYIYHTVPRLLTLWLDNGEDKTISGTDVFNKINDIVANAVKEIPAYKWFTAFPQIVSRVGHNADKVYSLLSQLIVIILQEYPRQALWLFASVVRSTKPQRETRGRVILEQLRSSPSNNRKLARFIADSVSMTNELLALCDRPVDDEKRTLSMTRDFPRLKALGHSELLIPLQESLTVNLPSSTSAEAVHQPFPTDAPTFNEFADEIEIMKSMAKPRKITINGSDGQIYMFLGKPKDDLRKDARLMDFNSIINKLLKTNSDARRRQLHIRTYGVVTLNEECGFIQWVPNTIPIRPVLLKYYDAMRIRNWTNEMGETFRRIKEANDAVSAELFVSKILPLFPPVFHEWFIETFPEPSAWLASRLSYGRTAAVMSMVGYILGLGDRHCENILLDVNTGDVIHVDFNCLFEKGKNLETPERVPFRLTQNIVDGLGITGVEGVFRIACELTMTLLRENRDSLMSVLDAFVHDPLVEWEDEKRKRDRSRNQPRTSTESIAKTALEPIGSKLEGYYDVTKAKHEQTRKLLSTNNLVESLIQEARSEQNLAKMYPGWAAWY